MAGCATGAEWASESAYDAGPLLQIVPAILRTLTDFAQTPSIARRRAVAARFSMRGVYCEQQRTARHRTPLFKRRLQDYAKDWDWLVTSRPLRRRLRWRRCRCFFPLCHFRSLNGPGSIVER